MIIRRKHKGNFATIPNSTANDDRLGVDALGILVYLLAKPSDWTVLVTDLRRRFHIGRDRVYAILKELESNGYVQRNQSRSDESKQYKTVEYVVYDCPVKVEGEPLPEMPESAEYDATEGAASVFAVSGISGHILKTDSTKPSTKEHSASNEAGADAPSVSKRVWKEGRELLNNSSSKPLPSIIGKWLKRTPSEEHKEKLLGIIRAANRAGTADPIAYVTKALDQEFPPAPEPKLFDATTWQRNCQAAIKTNAWSQAWGPPPGKKGCVLPPELITPQLTRALSERKIEL
jgi:hypothetical protein